MARPFTNTPTPTQKRVLDFIREFMAGSERAPTEREIAKHFHWKSKYAARQNIGALVRKGLLERTPGVARGMRVVRRMASHAIELRAVPLLGAVPAGIPIEAVEDVDGVVGIDQAIFPEAEVFALRVKGESMVGAGINDGDIALVHQTPVAEDGDIVVAMMDGEATLKRLLRKEGRVVLHAENPEFKDLVVRPNVEFNLAGVVVGIVRRMK
ncbi:MAG: transcriptional repressor LexA [Planctomycetes bacterium]|nr:transcriptional repressor LexA [Planctomycetota bacterium]